MKNLLVLFIAVCSLTLSVRAADADAAAKPPAAGEDNLIRSFHVNVPEEQLTDLRKRIIATRWPEKETVTDASQGVQLATIQELARYWATDYDWRRCEAKLNELYLAPRSWTERAYPKLIYYNKLDKGGHFAAWEQPELFSQELRAAFKSLR